MLSNRYQHKQEISEKVQKRKPKKQKIKLMCFKVVT